MINKRERPFQPEVLDEERKGDKRDRVTVNLNVDERAWLNEIKSCLNITSDSVALKLGMESGLNAIKTQFSQKSWVYLMSKRRVRASDYLQKKC